MTTYKPLTLFSLLVAIVFLTSSCSTVSHEAFNSEINKPETPTVPPAPNQLDQNSGDSPCNNPEQSFNPESFPSIQNVEPKNMPPGSIMDEIYGQGKLRVGTAQGSLLLSYQSDDGELEGFDVDIAKLVADAIFGPGDNIEFVSIASAEREPALQDDIVDIVVQSMTITCERWENVNFSSVYYQAGQKLLVRTDSDVTDLQNLPPEIKKFRVCAADGSTSLQNMEGFERVSTTEELGIPVARWTDCLVLFQQEQVDAISTDDVLLAGLAGQDPLAQVVGDSFSNEPYGVATPKGGDREKEFTAFVNATLEKARQNGNWQKAYDKWLAETLGPQSPPQAAYK